MLLSVATLRDCGRIACGSAVVYIVHYFGRGATLEDKSKGTFTNATRRVFVSTVSMLWFYGIYCYKVTSHVAQGRAAKPFEGHQYPAPSLLTPLRAVFLNPVG